jgi:hypothetical protein
MSLLRCSLLIVAALVLCATAVPGAEAVTRKYHFDVSGSCIYL